MEPALRRAERSALIWDWSLGKMIRVIVAHSYHQGRRPILAEVIGWERAQYIVGPFGPDTDLRRYGERLMQRGGKNGNKRAIVAVARKLAVLLHRLWMTGEVYEPLRNSNRQASTKAA